MIKVATSKLLLVVVTAGAIVTPLSEGFAQKPRTRFGEDVLATDQLSRPILPWSGQGLLHGCRN